MLKYWRVLLLVITVLGAMFAIGLKAYPYGRNGVEILYVSGESPFSGILEQGMLITEIDGNVIMSTADWDTYISQIGNFVKIKANNIEYEIQTSDNVTNLGIEVIKIERTNLDFGLDIRGGTRIILSPTESNVSADMIEQVMSTLQTRANLYGLREMKFYSIQGSEGYFIQIEAAGIGREIVEDLLSSQGKFEAKISKPVLIVDGAGELQLGDNKYPVKIVGDAIEIEGQTIEENGTFILEDIGLKYQNKSDISLFFIADVLDGDDVEMVFSDPQKSGISSMEGGYRFFFTIQVSNDGAQRFGKVTSGIPKFLDINSGDEFLRDAEIFLLLDGKPVSTLRISADLEGKAITTPQITGSRVEKADAIEEKLRMQTILRSGALPTRLETASVDVISPTLGEGFFNSAINSAIVAALAVFVIIFIRYRRIRVAIPLVLIGLSEVVIILGIAAMNDIGIWGIVLMLNILVVGVSWYKKHEIDIYAWIGAMLIPILGMMTWTIDLAAIGGIIAAIGTGMDQLIIITDETLAGKESRLYSIKEKIKRAFFIIFGAASTTIAAMLPLMFLGIGLIRGFAITTIVGVLVGILITRPAFAKIVETLGSK